VVEGEPGKFAVVVAVRLEVGQETGAVAMQWGALFPECGGPRRRPIAARIPRVERISAPVTARRALEADSRPSLRAKGRLRLPHHAPPPFLFKARLLSLPVEGYAAEGEISAEPV